MTKRLAFIGTAGAGKTTLVGDVFTSLKKQHKNVEQVTEWIRTDIQLHGPMQSIWEQYRTVGHQRKIEDSVPTNVDFIITDSGTLTPYFYACLYVDNAESRQRLVLQDMYGMLLDDIYLRRYDHIFFLDKDATYAENENILKDGTRYQNEDEIDLLDEHMRMVFTKLHALDNIHHLTGPLDGRKDEVLNIILEEKLAIPQPSFVRSGGTRIETAK